MKTEGETDDVMIKQELDIGPTVLQPKTTSCMLRTQTMMEVAGSNFQQCPMRPRRCYRGPRVRREVLAERPKPVTPATHSDVKDCRGIPVTVKVEFDSDAHQGLNSKDAAVWECSVTNTGVSVKEEGFVMKTEGEMDETMIKQELDIGAMVLQSKTIPYLSPPKTLVSSHAGSVSHSGSRTGQDLRPASPEIFSQSSSLIEDSVVSSGASLVLNVIGADNVLRVPRSHARGSDSEDTQEGGQCKHCVKSRTECKCGTRGLKTEAYTQMGGKHCKYNTMKVCLNNPTSNSYRKKPYECEHCEYSTSRLDNLKMHTRTHTGEKPYRCEQCGYSASQLSQLKRHMRTHLGDSPYKCEECDYSTFLLANLKTHIRTHTREDPYNCKRCGYTTFELDNFRTHVYTHVEEKIYKCEQCEYSTSRLHNLKMHRRIHTGVKPYRCERCDYSASQQGYLKRHMWTHMNKGPFKCECCEYSSFQLINLEKHMHTHMTDNHKM